MDLSQRQLLEKEITGFLDRNGVRYDPQPISGGSNETIFGVSSIVIEGIPLTDAEKLSTAVKQIEQSAKKQLAPQAPVITPRGRDADERKR